MKGEILWNFNLKYFGVDHHDNATKEDIFLLLLLEHNKHF